MRALGFGVLITVLFLTGCSSKRYFEPEKTEGSISFSRSLPSSIKDVRRVGATLENGMVVTKEGLIDISLPKEFLFIGSDDEYLFASSDCGRFLTLKRSDKSVKELNFGKKALSAKSQKGVLAVVFGDNSIMLYELSNGKTLFAQKEESAFAVDARVASPFFLKDLALIPTLSGSVVAVDLNSYKVVRKMTVKSGSGFDSVIFLDVLQDRLVAATQKRVISVSPDMIHSKEFEIRDIVFVRDRVYILTNDGSVILADNNLVEKKRLKFPFARFVGVIHGKYIYAIEKEGYLIALDADLATSFVYELPDSIDEKIFSGHDKIYFEDGFFQLSK